MARRGMRRVVGEGMELKAHGVGGEGAARQACPFDRALSFLDPLLRRAALIVEGDDTLGWPRQIADDEADPRGKAHWGATRPSPRPAGISSSFAPDS